MSNKRVLDAARSAAAAMRNLRHKGNQFGVGAPEGEAEPAAAWRK